MRNLKTLKDFNKALKVADVPTELVKGNGYFWFTITENGCDFDSVFTSAYSHMPPSVWEYEILAVLKKYGEHISALDNSETI